MSAITDELNRLGALTPDQIAADFRERGIKGRRGDCEQCPVANDLKAVGGCNVKVGPNRVYWAFDMAHYAGDMPDNVRRFVHHFDQGDYADLE